MTKVGSIRIAEATGHFTRIGLEGSQFLTEHRLISTWDGQLPATIFRRISGSLITTMNHVLSYKVIDRNGTHAFMNGLTKLLLLSRLEPQRLKQLLREHREEIV